jgi:hypothetical protein
VQGHSGRLPGLRAFGKPDTPIVSGERGVAALLFNEFSKRIAIISWFGFFLFSSIRKK